MQTPDPTLLEACKSAYPALVADWEPWSTSTPPTCHGQGLEQVGRFVADALRALGAQVATVPVADKDHGFSVVGHVHGAREGQNPAAGPHGHSLPPWGRWPGARFASTTRAWPSGPGVSDDKSGVVLCLYALKLLHACGFQDFAEITLFANCQEENGSHTSRELIQKLAREHDFVLCAEAGAPGDAVCVSRPGSGNLVTEVKGVTAHAAIPGWAATPPTSWRTRSSG